MNIQEKIELLKKLEKVIKNNECPDCNGKLIDLVTMGENSQHTKVCFHCKKKWIYSKEEYDNLKKEVVMVIP